MSRENELPIFSCKCFIGHHGPVPVHIYRWGGEGVLAGTLGFQGERRGIRYTYSTSNTPRPRRPRPPPARAINNGRSFMITRDFVTVCPST